MRKTILVTALMTTAALTAGLAQQEERRVEYRSVQSFSAAGPANRIAGAPADVLFRTGPGTFFFESSEMAFDAAVVKGAPYSADTVTETTQTLSDGNRIHRTTKASLFRDSEGRTRREQTLGEVGPLTVSGDPIQTIVINDPVAETTYMLNTHEKVAHKLPGRGGIALRTGELATKVRQEVERGAVGAVGAVGAGVAGPGQHFEMRIRTGGEMKADSNLKKEPLGTQVIEGVPADGTRTTVTIPAGAIGNERPIEIVTETWYSSQLHTTVMTKTTDPRSGETVYSLKNVKLGEPASNLFTVPADYTIQ